MLNRPIPNAIKIEMKTVDAMIHISCSNRHRTTTLCKECFDLRDYALYRLELCRFGAEKPTCVRCPVHCYKPDMKEQIREVMRYAGPRMLFYHPWLSLIHLWKDIAPFFIKTKKEYGRGIYENH